MDIKKISALQVAVRVLEGTAGGYSEKEKYEAKLVLMQMILELEKQ